RAARQPEKLAQVGQQMNGAVVHRRADPRRPELGEEGVAVGGRRVESEEMVGAAPAALDEPGDLEPAGTQRDGRRQVGDALAELGLVAHGHRLAGRPPPARRAARFSSRCAICGRRRAASRSVRFALYPSSVRSQCWYALPWRSVAALLTPWFRSRRSRSAMAGSRVATAPPSPQVRFLVA